MKTKATATESNLTVGTTESTTTKMVLKKKKALKAKNPKEEPEELIIPAAKVEKKKVKLANDITSTNNTALVEKVISTREIKYKYPEDCVDTLSRKTFRQKVRNKIHQYENRLYKLSDRDSKEYKKVEKELLAFQTEYVKKEAAV